MVSGAIQGKELRPLLHLGVVVIEKGAFDKLYTYIGTKHYSDWRMTKQNILKEKFWYFNNKSTKIESMHKTQL